MVAMTKLTNEFFSSKIGLSLVAMLLLSSVLVTVAPTAAQTTYSVTIKSSLDDNTSTSVPITMDGIDTGYSTPYTFTGITGVHNFTVPYDDLSGHPFALWWNKDSPIQDNCKYVATIIISPENVSTSPYYAYYDEEFDRSALTWAEMRYFVTPDDPAVIAAAGSKSWNEIIDWVATNIAFNASLDYYQWPNETLAYHSGVCREYSGLAVSMLEARGYTAYVVAGNTTGNLQVNHAWIAVELKGTLYHFEPQLKWVNQPSPESWENGRTAWYFYNDQVFLPASPTQTLPPDTYEVTIVGSFSGKDSDVHTRIFMDGIETGYSTPHTFTDLKGTHSFFVPYQDDSGNLFYAWSTNVQSNRWLSTITTSQGGTFIALYNDHLNLSRPSPAQMQYFITPNDPAIIAASAGKNWSQIVTYVSSLPYIQHSGDYDPWLFPNQTLSGGFFPEFALLCCSMLRANGYTAYYASMSDNRWTAWIVLDIDGTLTPINPYTPYSSQFNSNADYYADENGIYLATVTEGPEPTPTPTPSSGSSSSNTNTNSHTSSKQPNATQQPSEVIPEFPAGIVLIGLLIFSGAVVALRKKLTQSTVIF